MYYKQIFMNELGSLSYLIGCKTNKTACVVNPDKDVKKYLETAEKYEMEITHIFETPSYNKRTSGNLKLSFKTGADIFFLQESEIHFKYKLATEGNVFNFGTAMLKIVDGQNYEPFSTTIKITDTSEINEPWIILSRHSIFFGDVEQPDMSKKEFTNNVSSFVNFEDIGYNHMSFFEIPYDNLAFHNHLELAI